jgi:DNA-binding transcriptional LysR family regulator
LDQVALELVEIERRLRSPDAGMSGEIRLTMPDAFAAELLMPDLALFVARYPQIRLTFLPSYEELDLDRREADMAIRVTDRPPESLIGRRLGSVSMTAYGSAEYLARHDPLTAPEACLWIESGFATVRAPRFKARHFDAVPMGPRCNNVLLQLAAVRAHMGITLLPCAFGDADPALRRVGDIDPVHAQDVWLLTHPDLRGVARAQALAEFLVQTFAGLEGRLQGEPASAPPVT